MKCRRIFYVVFALVIFSALAAFFIACKSSSDENDVSTEQSGTKQSVTAEEENLEPIVGTEVVGFVWTAN